MEIVGEGAGVKELADEVTGVDVGERKATNIIDQPTQDEDVQVGGEGTERRRVGVEKRRVMQHSGHSVGGSGARRRVLYFTTLGADDVTFFCIYIIFWSCAFWP